MNAYKLNAVLSQDGQLLLDGLPFQAGELVEVIVLAQADTEAESPVVAQPFAQIAITSTDQDYLMSIASAMDEWESEADEAAYQDL